MRYRVYLHSKPGMWEFYKGHVDVFATSREEAEGEAIRKLATGNFRDRGWSAWVVEKVETRRG